MKQIRNFRDLPNWEEARKILAEELRLDDETIADVGEQIGDSLDLVETCMALEEAFGSRRPKRRKS
jgi:acyl carrier protein